MFLQKNCLRQFFCKNKIKNSLTVFDEDVVRGEKNSFLFQLLFLSIFIINKKDDVFFIYNKNRQTLLNHMVFLI